MLWICYNITYVITNQISYNITYVSFKKKKLLHMSWQIKSLLSHINFKIKVYIYKGKKSDGKENVNQKNSCNVLYCHLIAWSETFRIHVSNPYQHFDKPRFSKPLHSQFGMLWSSALYPPNKKLRMIFQSDNRIPSQPHHMHVLHVQLGALWSHFSIYLLSF